MKRLFEKSAKSACALMLAAELFLPVIVGIGNLTGRTLILYWPAVEHEARAALIAVLSLMAFVSHRKMNRFARISAAFLPPVTFVCGFMAMMSLNLTGNRLTSPVDVICIALECVLSVCVFLRCAPRSEIKIVMAILSGLMLPVISMMLMFGLVFIGFGGCYESEPAVSPDGRWEAVLAYIDEGAMGGSNVLEIRERGEGVNILIGRLRAQEEVYLGRYEVYDGKEFVSLTWKDQDTLLVGGREVEIDMKGYEDAMTGRNTIRGALAGMLAFAVFLILPFLALSGCQVEEKKPAEPTDGVDVAVEIHSGDVYGVSVEYFVSRKALGGQACSPDPMRTRAFAQSEEILFQFNRHDLQEYDLADGAFGLIFSVLLPGEGSEEIGVFWEWQAEKGKKYSFVLTGSREEGYAVRAEFEAKQTEVNDLPDGALN